MTKAKKPKMPVEQVQTTTKPLTNKRHAFDSERHNGSPPPPPPMHNHHDQDRALAVESEKTYSIAFAKRQAKLVAQVRRDKTPPKVVDREPGISLEGRGLDRGDFVSNKDTQLKKKPRKADTHKGNLLPPPKLRSGPLNYETGVERRPSIERGGTNTIEMEVSGVGSRGSSRGKENSSTQQEQQQQPPPLPSSQPQAGKEGGNTVVGSRKRQKHSPAAEDTDTGMPSSTPYALSKPPVPPASMERSTNNSSLSAPIKNTQKKPKKSRQHSHQTSSGESGYGTAGDETPNRKSSTATADMDSSMNGGGGGSPSESQLIVLQPFNNPELGLRESIAKIGSDDWSAKCNGMIGIRQVAMYHPTVLQPQLHSVVLAVQKEVCTCRYRSLVQN